jgi:hypothetical protein
MNDENRLQLLRESLLLTKTGYAGLNKLGQKVDRRKHPEAVPFAKNSMLNIPEPKCISCEKETLAMDLTESLCSQCKKEN